MPLNRTLPLCFLSLLLPFSLAALNASTPVKEHTDTVRRMNNTIQYVIRISGVDSQVTEFSYEEYPISEKTYRNGAMHGTFTWFMKNGKPYRVQRYNQNLPDGQWLEYDIQSGILLREVNYAMAPGVWPPSSYRHGPYKVYTNNNIALELGEYYEGNRHGLWLIYDENGVIRSKKTYYRGKESGESIQYVYGRISQYQKFKINEKGQSVLDGESYAMDQAGRLMSKGQWVNGLQEGLWKEWYANGNPRSETTFKKGMRTGTEKLWFDNGRLRQESNWIIIKNKRNGMPNPVLHGAYKSFSQKAILLEETTYEKGEKHGPFRFFYEDGTLRNSGFYDHGLYTGKMVEYSYNGKPRAEYEYRIKTDSLGQRYSAPVGHFKRYYANGQLQQDDFYVDGVQEGISSSFTETGRLQWQGEHKNGLLVHYTEWGENSRKENYTEKVGPNTYNQKRRDYAGSELYESWDENSYLKVRKKYNQGKPYLMEMFNGDKNKPVHFNISISKYHFKDNIASLRMEFNNTRMSIEYNPDGSMRSISFMRLVKEYDHYNAQQVRWDWTVDGKVVEYVPGLTPTELDASRYLKFHSDPAFSKILTDSLNTFQLKINYAENAPLAVFGFKKEMLNGPFMLFYPNGDTFCHFHFDHGATQGWGTIMYNGNAPVLNGNFNADINKTQYTEYSGGEVYARYSGMESVQYRENGQIYRKNEIVKTPFFPLPKKINYYGQIYDSENAPLFSSTEYTYLGSKSRHYFYFIFNQRMIMWGPDSTWYGGDHPHRTFFRHGDSSVGQDIIYHENGKIYTIREYNGREQYERRGKIAYYDAAGKLLLTTRQEFYGPISIERNWPFCESHASHVIPKDAKPLSRLPALKEARGAQNQLNMTFSGKKDSLYYTHLKQTKTTQGTVSEFTLGSKGPFTLRVPDSTGLQLTINPCQGIDKYMENRILILSNKNYWKADIPSIPIGVKFNPRYFTENNIYSRKEFGIELPFEAIFPNSSLSFSSDGSCEVTIRDSTPENPRFTAGKKMHVTVQKAWLDLDPKKDNFHFSDVFTRAPQVDYGHSLNRLLYTPGYFTGMVISKALISFNDGYGYQSMDSLVFNSTQMLVSNSDLQCRLELDCDSMESGGCSAPGIKGKFTIYSLKDYLRYKGLQINNSYIDYENKKLIFYVKTYL